jgi:hypothetical protein
VSLTQVDPAIFADQPIASASPAVTAKELGEKTQPMPAVALSPQPSMPLATAELEVEALGLLNQVGADLGEQISVTRTADGMLQVAGIVETDQRKSEIIKALGPIATNPAVRIEIQTVAEVVAKQTPTKAKPSPSVRRVEIAGNTMATEPELHAYFASKGKDTDEAVRQYAAQMVNLSAAAMDHLWAMRRLLNQFSDDRVRPLTPESRAKWIGLLRVHARSYQRKTEGLRRELHSVFFPGQSLAVSSEGPEIRDTNELSRVVEQLFELGSANDRVIRSAFTSSTGEVMTTVIKTPQFWQSLKSAESLAGRIETAH